MNKNFFPKVFLIFGIVIFLGLILIAWPYKDYYFLSYSLRPLHPKHIYLRSSGYYGLIFGIAGTFLLIINLSYLVRKRFINIDWLGSLRSWMAFHVFTGLLAGSLILFHSAFYPHSALGTMGFFSIAIVILTGLVGRYIYARTPRSLEGKELALEEIRQHLLDYQDQLKKWGLGDLLLNVNLSPDPHLEASFFQVLLGLIAGDRELHRKHLEAKKILSQSTELNSHSHQILWLVRRYYMERQWFSRYSELRALMGRWRFFHRWFAILVLVVSVFHVLISIRLGQLWILKG